MKNSKKIQKVISYLDEIEDLLKYYTNGNARHETKFRDIRALIDELGLDKKKDHARFAKKLRWIWEQSEK